MQRVIHNPVLIAFPIFLLIIQIAIEASLSSPVSSHSSDDFDWTSVLVNQPLQSSRHSEPPSTPQSSHHSPRVDLTKSNVVQNSETNSLSKAVNSAVILESSNKQQIHKNLEDQHSTPQDRKKVSDSKRRSRRKLYLERKKASTTEYYKKKYQKDKQALKSKTAEEQEFYRIRKNEQQKKYRQNTVKRLGFSNRSSAILHHCRILEKTNDLNEEQKRRLEKDREKNRMGAKKFRERRANEKLQRKEPSDRR